MPASHLMRFLAVAVAIALTTTFPSAGRDDPRQAPTPPPFDVVEKSIAELQAAMTRGEVTSRELVDLYFARIDAYDQTGPEINAFVTLNPRARDQAAALDAERKAGRLRGPLHGIPVVVKDNFNTADMRTTGGSIALATFQPSKDAFHVAALRNAGAVVIGKTNLHELAAGIVTVSSFGGQTRNPYDPSRNPGGSSGGTGAAIAANFAATGLGSDTCGSIRIPASHNALVGLRPAKSSANIQGVMPLSSSQDVAGPLARSIADLAVMLDEVAVPAGEPGARTTFVAAVTRGQVSGAKVGVLTSLFGNAKEDEEAAGIVRDAIRRLRGAGIVVVDVEIAGLDGLLQGSSLIDQDFKFDLADYLAAASDSPVRSLGEILEAGLYHQALEATFRRRNAVTERDGPARQQIVDRRAKLRAAVDAAMTSQQLTALAYPTMKRKPAVVGEAQAGSNCQLSASTGLPALSVPAGFTADGLPIGLELLGPEDGAARLLILGQTLENASPRRQAPASTPRLTRGAPVSPPARVTPGRKPGSTPSLRGTFQLSADQTALRYDVEVTGVAADDVLLVAVRRVPETGANGPIVSRLARSGQLRTAGDWRLRPADREDLKQGRLYVQVFTRAHPHGAARLPITVKTQ